MELPRTIPGPGPEIDRPADAQDQRDDLPPARRSWGRRLARIVAGLLLLILLMVSYLAVTAPLSKSLQPIAPPEITLLAANGTPIARNGAITDAPVKVRNLPPHVVQAFLAIEDRRFYTHWGIDPRGIARATWSNLTGGSTQGGSTITQQLAKFTFLTSERSMSRKAREMLIAFWLEAWLTKDEILERYLSNAYFGDNTYGLRAASLHYFHRQPERLRTGEAALLAGLMKAPSRLSPTNNFALSQKRMRVVLGAMADAGYMTPQEARAVPVPRLDVRSRSELPTGTYFADWALPQARQIEAAGYAGQTYRTTLDARLQAAAHRAIRQVSGKTQVALVAMRKNGEVVAMVGGRDYAASPFNRVTQARRQPGSTFKLFVYLAALKAGMEPDDTIANTPIETGSYRPQNAGGAYSPTITLEDAFARSSNVAAVRLFSQVGDEAVIDMARRLGVSSPLPTGDPSLALGTASMTLLELTAAYAGVAANSFPVVPRAFPVPEAGWFDWLLDGKRSLSSSDHEAIEQMLRATINNGTGRGAMLRGPNFGKTGTSQENRDALFVGYSGDLVVGVWVGNDDNSPLRGISGGTVPARIWRDFMRDALGERRAPPVRKAADPQGPVQPLDVPEIGDIPVGADSHIRIEDGQAVISTRVEGVPLDLRVDGEGLSVGRREPASPPASSPGSPPGEER
ncbi:transglycosylase domain-containing protein [Novosphingobium soli]|uniref:peptidoglycan glycosyltransferase n=1 Tax=Novosphingobium soli TaxID=574956 RepID=A0ABV6CZT5_9SPHN